MKSMNPIWLVVNKTKQILTGLVIAGALMFVRSDAFARARVNETTILQFTFNSTMTNTVVASHAHGSVHGFMYHEGNANSLSLTISLSKLDPTAKYQLVAYLGDDINPTSVTNFTTSSKGVYSVTYVKEPRTVASGKLLPYVLSPFCNVRELAIVNDSSRQTVLRSDLTDPDSLNYAVNSFMANTGFEFVPNATARLVVNANKNHTSLRLTSSGLNPKTVYVLTINGNAAQTNKTDRSGKLNLNLKALPPGSPDVLGINMIALTDRSGTVVLTTDGLGVPCDTTAPIVSFTVPDITATNVAINQKIAVTFSEAMNPLSISTNTLTLKQGSTVVPGTVSYVGVTATFNPSSPLANSTTYTAMLTTGAKDFAGNALAAAFSWNFTTGAAPDTTPPTVSFTVPANAVTGVATNQQIAATFSEAMDPLTVTTATFTLQQGATVVSGAVTYAGFTAIFSPNSLLAASTTYTATISTGARDLAGNALATAFVWHFTTGAAPDTTPPTVSFIVPSIAAIDVSTNQKLAVVFSEPMDPLTVSTATFMLQQGVTTVTGTVAYAGVTATFKPISVLAAGTIYTATMTTGARDLAGNALAMAFVWHFTTDIATVTTVPADTTPPVVIATVNANGAIGVPIKTKVGATFSEAMDPLTITTATFTFKQGNTPVAGTVTYSGVSAIFTPATNLTSSTVYTATITTGAKDLAENALASAYVWSWTTGSAIDKTAPIVAGTINANGAIGVPINTKVGVTFSEAMDPLTITTATFTFKQGNTPVDGLVSYSGLNAVFAPLSNLTVSTVYTATITTGAKDLAGNALTNDYVWSWTTSSSTDINPPTVIITSPTNTATDVALNQTVNATFSEALDPLTVITPNFTMIGPGGTAVTGTIAYVAASKIASFTPTSNLTPNTTYTNTVTVGFRDLAGNRLATNYVWTFTTGTLSDPNKVAIALGSAGTFAIMATDATSGSANVINGDVGLHPGVSQGIPPSEINGTIHVNDVAVIDAQAALLAAYNEAVNRSSNAQTLPGNLGGLTIYPGLYANGSSTGISGSGTTAILTLDAQGDPNAVFVFKMDSTLITDPGSSIVLSGGAQAKNIYWKVLTSATLGTTTIFKGNILADVSITVQNGCAVEGRLFAGSGPGGAGAVTIQSSTVTVPAP